ncbi:MAG TPA: DNA methyltransferase [Bradyrhizobium sp.]|jgi:DNA modification methylase|nr:DNA methyltransferase [Bradyrhizobium sp.]
MPIFFKTPSVIHSKPVIHAVISDEMDEPRQDQPLPSDPRIKLDARIKADCVEIVSIDALKPNPKNAKKHPERQIALLEENIEQFGFTSPILIDEANQMIGGHARYAAAKRLGFSHLPVIRLSHLTPAQKRAVAIADNKLAELAPWDLEILAEEFEFLTDPETDLGFDPRITGFETVELDQLLGDQADDDRADPADEITPVDPETPAVTCPGDAWDCDSHKLLCGDATNREDCAKLMGDERAQIGFEDFPYNVPNAGHVTKREGVREFAMARGEMTSRQFIDFLSQICNNILAYLAPGAVAYFCMDWRHLRELQAAADAVFGELKNLIVWVKANAGLGSFYRSQHELIFVYTAPGRPINNFGLGAKGRHRTNVWKYPGLSSFGRGRDETLAMHPTVKPVAMVADALMDCSDRGDIVLDVCGGSGTSMIAAERTGRRARLIEIDPLYCDLIVQRWQKFSGKTARLAETNETFDEVKARRGSKVKGD